MDMDSYTMASGVSFSISITLAIVYESISITSSTWDRYICGIHAWGAFKPNIRIAGIEKSGVCFSRDQSQEGRCDGQKFHDDDAALIFRIQLIPVVGRCQFL